MYSVSLCMLTAVLVTGHLHTHPGYTHPVSTCSGPSEMPQDKTHDLVEFAQKGELRAAQSPNLSNKKLNTTMHVKSPIHDRGLLGTTFISVTLTFCLLDKFPYLPLLCLLVYHNREMTGITHSGQASCSTVSTL